MTRLLWDALGDVPNRRGRQGRHYELRSVLGIALSAMLAGANDLRVSWRWGRRTTPRNHAHPGHSTPFPDGLSA
jgi:uncharacterized membrane protein